LRFQRLPPPFSLMPDSKIDTADPRPDIGRFGKPEMSATETGSGNREVEIALERRVLADTTPTCYPTFSTMTRLNNGTADTARHRPTSETRNVGHGTGKWKPQVEITMNERSWRCDSNDLFHILDHLKLKMCHCRHCPRSTDIRNSKCRRKPEVPLTSDVLRCRTVSGNVDSVSR